ncbi:hypothetical protein AB0F88_26815 [Streptosporangium sp. NPDC023963]|uniref:hypothetical protein n=1 Tax=Streptosporangium sp. NPDC023963 TaxID=3155608 RepID=UPI003444E9C1
MIDERERAHTPKPLAAPASKPWPRMPELAKVRDQEALSIWAIELLGHMWGQDLST